MDREIPSGDKPWGFVMGELFQYLPAVTAQMMDDTVENRLFACGEDAYIKRCCLLNGIIAIVPIPG